MKKVDNIRVKVEYVVEISNFEIPEELFDEMEIKYFIYHETFDNNGKSFNEAQQMSCASGNKEKVTKLLQVLYKNGLMSFGCGKDPYRIRFLIPAVMEDKDIAAAKTIIEKSVLECV